MDYFSILQYEQLIGKNQVTMSIFISFTTHEEFLNNMMIEPSFDLSEPQCEGLLKNILIVHI